MGLKPPVSTDPGLRAQYAEQEASRKNPGNRNKSQHPERYKIRVSLASGNTYDGRYRYGARDRAESAAKTMQNGPAVLVQVLDTTSQERVVAAWARESVTADAVWERIL